MSNQKLSEIKSILKSIIIDSNPDNWMTLKDVCKYTQLSEPTIRRYIRKGKLKVSRKTGKLLFKMADIDRWLEIN